MQGLEQVLCFCRPSLQSQLLQFQDKATHPWEKGHVKQPYFGLVVGTLPLIPFFQATSLFPSHGITRYTVNGTGTSQCSVDGVRKIDFQNFVDQLLGVEQ